LASWWTSGSGELTVILSSNTNTSRGFLKVLRKHVSGRPGGNGLAAGFGVSLDTTEIARLPDSLEEARLALDFSSATRPLTHFADIDLPEFLIRRADKAALRLIPQWTRHLIPTDGGPSADLVRTIRIFTECSLNVKQTARRLGLHTNTVYFRLNRIRKLSGIDPRTFSGASLLLTGLRLREAHSSSATNVLEEQPGASDPGPVVQRPA
jgi:sugar diacid utilization regulator